jgi:hypothetical protein
LALIEPVWNSGSGLARANGQSDRRPECEGYVSRWRIKLTAVRR